MDILGNTWVMVGMGLALVCLIIALVLLKLFKG